MINFYFPTTRTSSYDPLQAFLAPCKVLGRHGKKMKPARNIDLRRTITPEGAEIIVRAEGFFSAAKARSYSM